MKACLTQSVNTLKTNTTNQHLNFPPSKTYAWLLKLKLHLMWYNTDEMEVLIADFTCTVNSF